MTRQRQRLNRYHELHKYHHDKQLEQDEIDRHVPSPSPLSTVFDPTNPSLESINGDTILCAAAREGRIGFPWSAVDSDQSLAPLLRSTTSSRSQGARRVVSGGPTGQ